MKTKKATITKNKDKANNKVIMDEVEDWEEVNDIFGNVYSGNRFWHLREKKSKIDVVKEISILNKNSNLELLHTI